MSDEVMFAISTMMPVAAYEILSASLRNGRIAGQRALVDVDHHVAQGQQPQQPHVRT